MTPCCPCDELRHPLKPEISAGLPVLPRQPAGFPEYRLAMLRDIPVHAPLAHWRAREGMDLGIMLLEMWAYVLDMVGFYDERIANECYLRTAVRRPSLRKLVGLIGYQPRPALAASVVLAAIAEGNRPVILPPRTAFRSSAFDGEPPQVFETEIEHTIHTLKNQWSLAPVREPVSSAELLLVPGDAAIREGDLVLVRWALASSEAQPQAGLVTAIEKIRALDGNTYLKLEIASTEPMPDSNVELSSVELLVPTQKALPNLSPLSASNVPPDLPKLTLDAVYSQFAEDDPIIVQRGRSLHAATISRIVHLDIPVHILAQGATVPVTGIDLDPPLPAFWLADPERLAVHFDMRDGGRPTSREKTRLTVADFAPDGISIDGLAEPLTDDITPPDRVLLLDAQDRGILTSGSVTIDQQGNGLVKLAVDTPPFERALRTPLTVFGNTVYATRGESVFNEILGSGNASQAFQTFALSSKPLTYLNDPLVPGGRRSTLEIYVNGIRWTEVSSFFGVGPRDEVYISRQNDDHETVITFGDGERGARLPTGIDNVTATYRFGAGAAKPPAGAINQLAKPVEGLRRVASPVAPGGGADGDRPGDIRKNGPDSALILGRAVSIDDFEALAGEFGGVINAHVEWAWDETCQGAVVKVWFISDGGDIARPLKVFLTGQADPATPLVTEEAAGQTSSLSIDLEVEPKFSVDLIIEKVREALTNPENGILALQNVAIGRPLFRSRIFDAALSVAGTRSVRTMTVDGKLAPFAVTVAYGQYLDFLDNLSINAVVTTEAGGWHDK